MSKQQLMEKLESADRVLQAAIQSEGCRFTMLDEALTCLREARDTCQEQAAHGYLDNSLFHVTQLKGQPGPNGYHHDWALRNIDLARSAVLARNGRLVPESVNLAAINLIKSLPADDESSNRAEAFMHQIKRSRDCAAQTQIVEEVYAVAADGEWGWTLADINTLVFSLEHNPTLALTVLKNDSIEKTLSRLNRDTAQAYRDWLWSKAA
jgi:hypothetical protein